jgi:hypothetical protein
MPLVSHRDLSGNVNIMVPFDFPPNILLQKFLYLQQRLKELCREHLCTHDLDSSIKYPIPHFFAVLGFELRTYTLSNSTSPFL